MENGSTGRALQVHPVRNRKRAACCLDHISMLVKVNGSIWRLTSISLSVKASVALCKMTVQMKRDVSKQKTPHNNKWLGKQNKESWRKSQEEQSNWKKNH